MELVTGAIAAGGGCVARAEDGRVVFVRHALPGERVVAEVTDESSSFLRADAVQILESSADRVEPAMSPRRTGPVRRVRLAARLAAGPAAPQSGAGDRAAAPGGRDRSGGGRRCGRRRARRAGMEDPGQVRRRSRRSGRLPPPSLPRHRTGRDVPDRIAGGEPGRGRIVPVEGGPPRGGDGVARRRATGRLGRDGPQGSAMPSPTPAGAWSSTDDRCGGRSGRGSRCSVIDSRSAPGCSGRCTPERPRSSPGASSKGSSRRSGERAADLFSGCRTVHRPVGPGGRTRRRGAWPSNAAAGPAPMPPATHAVLPRCGSCDRT